MIDRGVEVSVVNVQGSVEHLLRDISRIPTIHTGFRPTE